MSKNPTFESISFRTPSFKKLRSSSKRASRALSGSKSSGTKCERVLRRALQKMGLRFQKNARHLPGKPDLVFPREQVVVLCDGDFWHGKNWPLRKRKLQAGSNSTYWVAKIESNIRRDKFYTNQLRKVGWKVVHVWESEVLADPSRSAKRIAGLVSSRRNRSDNKTDIAIKQVAAKVV